MMIECYMSHRPPYYIFFNFCICISCLLLPSSRQRILWIEKFYGAEKFVKDGKSLLKSTESKRERERDRESKKRERDRDRESKKKKVFIINWCAEKKNFKSQRAIKSVFDQDWRCSWYKGTNLLNNKIGNSCRTKAQTDEKRNGRIFWSWKIEKEMWIRFHLWRASNILHNINKE